MMAVRNTPSMLHIVTGVMIGVVVIPVVILQMAAAVAFAGNLIITLVLVMAISLQNVNTVYVIL
tara:strand:+ start:398 stop:589 length:192 start_codon:yes stop_codon:yes gene_type:complete